MKKQSLIRFITTVTIILIALLSQAQNTSSEKYFRHLRYNHVSPLIPITGIYEIDKHMASNIPHYVFKYDVNDRLTEIINKNIISKHHHPLTSLSAYKTIIDYTDSTEIYTYYDENSTRIKNDRNVYKEVFFVNQNNEKYKLCFYDIKNNEMESNWGIAYYIWSKKEDLIIEKRYNLKNELVNISPYFDFGITGILIGENGIPKANYNLNSNLEIHENSFGIASYKDEYDKRGKNISYSYYDKNDKLTTNPWGYAIGRKKYYFDKRDKLINKEEY